MVNLCLWEPSPLLQFYTMFTLHQTSFLRKINCYHNYKHCYILHVQYDIFQMVTFKYCSCVVYVQDIIENDAVSLDWMFKCSIIMDIASVCIDNLIWSNRREAKCNSWYNTVYLILRRINQSEWFMWNCYTNDQSNLPHNVPKYRATLRQCSERT